MSLFRFSYLLLFLLLTNIGLQAQDLPKQAKYSDHKYMPFYNLKKIGNTSIFQGNKKKKRYFEGWYFKMVAQDGAAILSVIPGISLSANGAEQHAFIQIIDGRNATTAYFSFPIEAFSFSRKKFAIRIGQNYFSKDSIVLNIKQNDTIVAGTIKMAGLVHYKPQKNRNTAIMGWYRFVPFMQCYHGVVSLTHHIQGQLTVNNTILDFDNGKGYIEKDWGSSMPSSWVWMQSNHFSNIGSSLMLSVADVPWLGKSFAGFLGFLYYNNKIYPFATYKNSKLNMSIDSTNLLNIKIENKKNTFIISARSNTTGLLKAPTHGSMDRRVPESIDAIIQIKMLDKTGKMVYQDSTNIAGLEMVGDFQKLTDSYLRSKK